MALLSLLAGAGVSAPAAEPALPALPVLICTLHDGGETISATFEPSADPYAIRAVQTGHFRVKASISENDNTSALVKIYTYYENQQQYHLLHLEKYLVPLDIPAGQPPLRHGMHYLYSPVLGRELAYECNVGSPNRSAP